MKEKNRFPLLHFDWAIYVAVLLVTCFLNSAEAQIKVILDTDPGYDPDDVGCMAMLHSMASAGECEILAMMNATHHQESPLALSAINTFYRRPAIPIGDCKTYAQKIPAPSAFYSYHLANQYPHQLKHWDESHHAVALYREILASAQDTTIVLIITGTMHNFYDLLRSTSCKYSVLNGRDLVAKKVAKVVTMGGNFMDGQGHDRTNWGGSDYLCSYTNWSCLDSARNAMCRYVIDSCPAPFIASGWEVGCGDYHNANYGNVITGPGLKALPEDHITRVSYEYHFRHRENKTDISRHSNDQCALHYAVRGEGKNYQAFLNGKITLTTTGVCTWSHTPDQGQGYIQKKREKEAIANEIEALMMGARPLADTTKPAAPQNLAYHHSGNGLKLTWDPVRSSQPGSWIVAYHIYTEKEKIGIAYGSQFFISHPTSESLQISVRAVNASGKEGFLSSVTVQE